MRVDGELQPAVGWRKCNKWCEDSRVGSECVTSCRGQGESWAAVKATSSNCEI